MSDPLDRRRNDDSVDFRLEVLRRLGRLEDDRQNYHRDNVRRLEKLEQVATEIEPLVRELRPLMADWTGGDNPEEGMRREIKKLIDERRTIGLGWKLLVMLGAIVSTIFGAWVAFTEYVRTHVK